MENYGLIYLAKNRVNNKVYVGQTMNMKSRLRGHRNSIKRPKTYFHRALAKYGMNGFEWIIIDETAANKQELDTLEIKYIQEYNSTNSDFGYNLSAGGCSAGPYCEDVKKRLSELMLEQYASGKRISPQKGKPLSQKTLEALAEGRRRKFGNSSARKGQKVSEEQRKQMSEIRKGQHSSPKTEFKKGMTPWNKGVSPTEETLKKMSAARKDIPRPTCRKKILCIELNQVFEGIKETAKHFNRSPGNLVSALKGRQKTWAGYHWRYLDTSQATIQAPAMSPAAEAAALPTPFI